MAFVVSSGSLVAIERAAPPPVYSMRLGADRLVTDYGALWRVQPELRTVIDFVSRNIAQLGLHVFRRVDKNDRVRLDDHPLAALLERPNPSTTRFRLVSATVHDVCIFDTAYWLKVRNDDGTAGVRRIRPQRIYPTGEDWFDPEGYRILGTKGTLDVGANDVVHFRGYNPDDERVGTPPIESLRQLLSEEWAANIYREQLWRNSARLSGYIKRPLDAPDWGTKGRKKFQAEWQDQYAGNNTQHAGETPILEDGMEFMPAGTTPRDAQYVESRKLTREECARSFHVPLPMVGILDHATFCLPADALVSTERGPVPIGEVRVGDRAWSLIDGALRTASVLRSGQTGFKPLLTIRTQNRTLKCTDNHPVLVRRRLCLDENVPPTRRRYRWEHVWTPAGDLVVGDILVIATELPDHGGQTCPTRDVSEGFAEFCGLLLGDGNVSRQYGQPVGVAVARAATALYMDHYRAVMRDEFVHSARGGRGLASSRSRVPITLIEGERSTRFASVLAAEELDALGLGGTAHTKRVPAWVFGLAPKLRAAFLRGFLDADGSVDKKGRISYSSVNEMMLRQVREMCIGIGVPVTNIRCQRGTTTLPNGRTVPIAQWTFTCSDPGANQIIGSHDPRYVERLAAGQPFGTGGQTRYYAYPDRTGRVPLEPPAGCGHARVVSVEADRLAVPVYDVTVEGSHNFIADGVLVHNSNIKEQHKQLYQDCLGPWLEMMQQEVELQLLPDMPDNANLYVEFNIQEKLRGSFEEQALQIQTAVGGPWMTRNEARARFNLPQIDGGDELIVPLNVSAGGADPAVDDSTDDTGEQGQDSGAQAARQVTAKVDPAAVGAATAILERFFSRQEQAVQTALGARPFGAAKATVEQVFDSERWDRELSADLVLAERLMTGQAWAANGDYAATARSINAAVAAKLAFALAHVAPAGHVRELFRDMSNRAGSIAQQRALQP